MAPVRPLPAITRRRAAFSCIRVTRECSIIRTPTPTALIPHHCTTTETRRNRTTPVLNAASFFPLLNHHSRRHLPRCRTKKPRNGTFAEQAIIARNVYLRYRVPAACTSRSHRLPGVLSNGTFTAALQRSPPPPRPPLCLIYAGAAEART